MDIITRKDAQAQGLKQYYTGKACVRGHEGHTRKTSDGKCVACSREDDKKKYQNGGKERKIAYHKSDVYKEYQKKWRAENAERRRDQARARDKTPQRIAYLKKYEEEHKAEKAFRVRKRRGQLKQATVFSHEKKELNRIYRECPTGKHVDHIIPLSHDLVCGLHCIANLQYLDPTPNIMKSNKFNPETYTG